MSKPKDIYFEKSTRQKFNIIQFGDKLKIGFPDNEGFSTYGKMKDINGDGASIPTGKSEDEN